MCSHYRKLLTLCLCALWLPASLSCNMESMMVCHYYDELNSYSYTMMFTQSLTDFIQTCEKQKRFLGCAYSSGLTVGCSYGNLVTLHSLNSTHHAVCGSNLAAYTKSRPCILQTKDIIHECFRPFWREKGSSERCQELTEARECIKNSVMEKKECSSQDVRFLGKVIDSSFTPYAHPEVHNCQLTMSGGEEDEATTPTETTSTTSYTTLEDSTPTTDILPENTTSTVSSVKTVQEKKVGLAVAIASTGENSSVRCTLSASAASIMILTVLSTWF